ncbi:MAG: hypothetical protein H0U62_09190, partial [Actinobacteria bacterium]|nr:hypothetical protein [Actinomycetota bacterium]
MGFDITPDFVDKGLEKAGNAIEGGIEKGVDKATELAQGGYEAFKAARGEAARILGIGGAPSGDNGGSSNWDAWGHQAIRDMLDNTVEPETIDRGVQAWADKTEAGKEHVVTATSKLNSIVSGGWQGESADAAVAALGPINTWVGTLERETKRTSELLESSGDAVAQAKRDVPPPIEHNMARTLMALPLGPGVSYLDARAQEQAQEEARRQAVHVMKSVYSAPINANRSQVPDEYPRVQDQTVQLEQTPPGVMPLIGGGGGDVSGGVAGGGAPTAAQSYQPSTGPGYQPTPPPGAQPTPPPGGQPAPVSTPGQLAPAASAGSGGPDQGMAPGQYGRGVTAGQAAAPVAPTTTGAFGPRDPRGYGDSAGYGGAAAGGYGGGTSGYGGAKGAGGSPRPGGGFG